MKMSINSIASMMELYENMSDGHIKKEFGRLVRKVVNEFTDLVHSNRNPFNDSEINFLRQGLKIDAIRSVRNRTALSLFEAKNYVEEHMGPYFVSQHPFQGAD